MDWQGYQQLCEEQEWLKLHYPSLTTIIAFVERFRTQVEANDGHAVTNQEIRDALLVTK